MIQDTNLTGIAHRTLTVVLAVIIMIQAPATLAAVGIVQEAGGPVGTASATHPGGDFGPWTGDTGALNQPTNDTLTGTNEDVSISATRDTVKSENRFGIIIEIDETYGPNADFFNLELTNTQTGNQMVNLVFRGDGDLEHSGVNTGFEWRENLTYRVEIRNIDYGNNNFELYVNNENLGTYSFHSSASGFDRITLFQRTTNCGCEVSTQFTDIRLDGSAYSFNRFTDTVFKNFNDSDNTVSATGWGGWYESKQEDSSSIDIVSRRDTLTNNVENFGRLTADNQDITVKAWSESGAYSPDSISVKFLVSDFSGNNDDRSTIRFYNGDSQVFSAQIAQDGSLEASDGVTATDMAVEARPNITYALEFKNINWSANTYELYVNGEFIRENSFDTAADGINAIGIRQRTDIAGENSSVYFNDIRFDSAGYSIARFNGGVLKGFGDGSKNITAAGFEGWYEGLESSNPYILSQREDTTVGNLTASNEDILMKAWSGSGLYSPDSVSVKFLVSDFSGNNDDHSTIRFYNGDSQVFSAQIAQDGSLEASDGVTATDMAYDVRPNITYTIEFRNINWSANTYELYVNGEFIKENDFDTATDGFNAIGIRQRTDIAGQSSSLYFNDLRIGGPLIDKPEYASKVTGFGFKGWYETSSPFNQIDKGLVSGSFSVANGTNRDIAEIYSSGGFADVSPVSVDITVSDRTKHPDDTFELFLKHFADNHMAVRLHMSTPQDQFDPNSDVDGNAITIRDGGAWREIDIQWQNNTANTIRFESVNYADQSYSVRINGELAENPATGNNTFSMDGNLRDGKQNLQFELDTTLSESTGGYPDSDMTVEYSDLSLGQCSANCEAVEFFNVTTEQQVSFTDPELVIISEGDSLQLNIRSYMPHGSTQFYEVILIRDNSSNLDVTDDASVSSSDITVIQIFSSNATLVATSNESINQRVLITADYEGLSDTQNVTVANRSLENIDIMPSEQWTCSVLGCDDGDAFGGSGTWYIFGSEIQWILLAIWFGAAIGGIARNRFVAIGAINAFMLIFWILTFVSLGMALVTVFASIFMTTMIMEVPTGSQTRVEVDMNER